MVKRLALTLLMIVMSGAATSAEPTNDHQKIMARLKCGPVREYGGRPLLPDDGTDFSVTGYSAVSFRDDPAAVVFWCQRSADQFLLVFTKGGRLYHPQCAPYLEWSWPPQGLRLSKDAIALEDFRLLKNYSKHSRGSMRHPKGETSAMSIEDGTSVEKYFYCYRGNWLIRILD